MIGYDLETVDPVKRLIFVCACCQSILSIPHPLYMIDRVCDGEYSTRSLVPIPCPPFRLEAYLQRLYNLLYLAPLHPSSANVAHLLQDFLGVSSRLETLERLQRSRPERELRQALQVCESSYEFYVLLV